MFNFMSSKAMLPGQVEILIRRDIDRKMPLHDRERAIRRGGKGKTDLDDYLDIYVSDLQDKLLAEANKHRTVLSYERMLSRIPRLNALLNGLPIMVDEEVIDDEGNVSIVQVPNPLREGYESGHVMLDGLPLQIEEQLYDVEGDPTTTQLIDNPERIEVQIEHDTLVVGVTKIESKPDVMLIVVARQGQT